MIGEGVGGGGRARLPRCACGREVYGCMGEGLVPVHCETPLGGRALLAGGNGRCLVFNDTVEGAG